MAPFFQMNALFSGVPVSGVDCAECLLRHLLVESRKVQPEAIPISATISSNYPRIFDQTKPEIMQDGVLPLFARSRTV
jgi:hypothetical protein